MKVRTYCGYPRKGAPENVTNLKVEWSVQVVGEGRRKEFWNQDQGIRRAQFLFRHLLFFFSDTNDPFSFCCFFAEPGLTMHFSVEEEIEARGKKYNQGFPNFLGRYLVRGYLSWIGRKKGRSSIE
jgi:hypothetical protein